MKFSKNLMTGLIGLALMAAPITAAAQDNNRAKTDAHQAQVQSRSNESHARAPERQAAPAPRVESRDNGRAYKGAPAVTANREVRGEHNDGNWNNRDRDYNRGIRDHKDYGDREFDHDRDYAAGGWVMPNGYGGGACAWRSICATCIGTTKRPGIRRRRPTCSTNCIARSGAVAECLTDSMSTGSKTAIAEGL